jgi:disulfide bond formation protein DsbB
MRERSRDGLAAWLVVVGSVLALAVAHGAEYAGLVPCPLCLLERWPYRIAFPLGLLALLAPPRGLLRRGLLILAFLVFLGEAGLAFVHVGVEQKFWPSPLPECQAPRLTGLSPAERLAAMPAHPAKPCDDPTYLIPGLPLSMAALNGLYAVMLAIGTGLGLRARRSRFR